MDQADCIRNPVDASNHTRVPREPVAFIACITSTRLRDDDRPTSSDACIFWRGRICAIS